MSVPILQIFVSSTWLDLQPERKAVEAALQRLRETKFVGMEYFGSRHESTRGASLVEVDRSQVYVGIFGGRYGSGITAEEYRRSRELNLPCFIYFKDEATINPEEREAAPTKISDLASLKTDLRKVHLVTVFSSPDDLAAKVTADLHRWLFDQYLTPRLEKAARGELPHVEAESLLAAIKDLSQLNHELLDRVQSLPHLPIGAPFQAEPLPEYLVDRPDVSAVLLDTLLVEPAPNRNSLAITAIHGIGGAGKSVVASVLAHHPRVRQRFSDGVLWATLGQEPNLLSLLSGWVQALGDYRFRPDSPESTSAHLRTLLQEKATLLILDDVWDAANALPFLVGGSRCHVLITTRDDLIAQAVGAASYSLDSMTPQQSVELLTKRLQPSVNKVEQSSALDLAQALGNLPLAIKLAAAQIADGVSIDELLGELRAEIFELEALDLPGTEELVDSDTRKRLSVQAAFHLSLRRLSQERRERFAWLGVLPKNVTFGPAMVSTLWGTNIRGARETLRYLRDKALISLGSQRTEGAPIYRLHNLMHDSARTLLTSPVVPEQRGELPGMDLSLSAAHSELLKRYRATINDGPWHTLADDGYIHAHLVWHLHQAEQFEEIHSLLAEETTDHRNGWFQTRERLGQTAGYLEDLTLARLIVATANASLEQSTSNVGLEVRYALMVASVNTRAGNIPGPLLAQFAKTNPAQALAYVLRMDHSIQANVLAELALHLPESLLTEAVQTIWRSSDESYRFELLKALLPHLPQLLIQEIYNECNTATGYPFIFSLTLAPRLPDAVKLDVLNEGNELASANNNVLIRTNTLKELASCLPEPHKSAELETMLEGLDQSYAEQWVQVLLSHSWNVMFSPESLRRSQSLLVMRQMMWQGLFNFPSSENFADMSSDQVAQWLLNGSYETDSEINKGFRSYIFSSILQQFVPLFSNLVGRLMPPADFEEWFLARVHPQGPLASVIAQCAIAQHIKWFAPYFSTELLPVALQKSLTLEDDQSRFQALLALLPHLANSLKDQALTTALEIAQAKTSRYDKVWALIDLAPHLSVSHLEEVLHLATSLTNDEGRADESAIAEAITHLTPYLTNSLIREAVDITRTFQEESSRFETFVGLLPYLPDLEKTDVLDEAIKLAKNKESKHTQAQALAKLAPHLPESGLQEILEITLPLENANDRINILTAVAPYLTGPLLSQAMEIANVIEDDFSQSEVLSNLSFHLFNLDQHEQALAAARAIKDELFRADALAQAATHLDGQLKSDVLIEGLEVARGIESGFYRRRGESQLLESRGTAMAKLAVQLTEPQKGTVLQEALDTELMVEKGLNWKAAILANLSVRLAQAGYHQEALKGARAINEWYRAGTLARVAAHLPEPLKSDVFKEALDAALTTKGRDFRIEKSERQQGPRGSETGFKRRFSVDISPEEALRKLDEDPQLSGNASEGANRSLALADLAPLLPESLLLQCLDAVSALPGKMERLRVLTAIAPLVPEPKKTEILDMSLAIARAITGFRNWVQAGLMLIPHLCDLDRQQVINGVLVQALLQTNESDRFSTAGIQAQNLAEVLVGLAPHLQGTRMAEALDMAYSIEDPFWQGIALSSLAHRLAQSDLGHAMAVVRRIQDDSVRAEALSNLAPNLDNESLKDAIKLTHEITSGYFSRQNMEFSNGSRSSFTTVWNARVRALESLAPHLPSSSRMDLYRTWQETVEELAGGTRDSLLMNLYQSSVLFALGGVDAITEVAQAIEDVGRWWP
jgi:hypothetical protein